MHRFKWTWGKQGLPSQSKSYRKYTPLITDNCNLGCTYCFQRYKNNGAVVTHEILERFIRQVFEVEVPNQHTFEDVFIQFCGGEALLYPELIDHGMTIIKEYIPTLPPHRHLTINVLSNGTTLGNPKVREVFEKHPELSISVSLDGNREMHNKYRGGFDEIIENFGWLKSHFLRYGRLPRVAMTISPDSVSNLCDGFKFIVQDLGIPEVWVSLVMEDKRWMEDKYAEALYTELTKLADFMVEPENALDVWTNLFDIHQFLPTGGSYPVCSSMEGQLVCTPTGVLYPCYVHRNPRVKHDFSIGDVWNWLDPERYERVCQCTIENTKGLDECAKCDIGLGCKRCSAAFAEEYDSIYEADTRFCKAHHAKFFALDYLTQRRREYLA